MSQATTATPDPRILGALRGVSTSTLATQLYTRGIRQPYLVGVSPIGIGFDGFVGEAFTMRFIPAREDIDPMGDPYRTGNTLQWEAVESLQPGHVLVVDSCRDPRAASGGDILATRAMIRGASAVVTDGAFRDGAAIAELGFPAYAAAITSTTRPAFFHVADLQVPISCADVAVYPGDILVGDRDGVLVIPRALAPEIAGPSREQDGLEDYLKGRIRNGQPLWGIYPPSDEVRAEYAALASVPDTDTDSEEHPL
jgi:regulator of RNase E activity RraA